MTKTIKRILALAPAAALALTLAGVSPAQAAATTKTCTVGSFAYDEGPRLVITCTDNFQAYSFLSGTAGSCQSRSLETIKIWESMTMSMFLSGKHAVITYEPSSASCGVNSIYAITASP